MAVYNAILAKGHCVERACSSIEAAGGTILGTNQELGTIRFSAESEVAEACAFICCIDSVDVERSLYIGLTRAS